jgi:hypothetical protein
MVSRVFGKCNSSEIIFQLNEDTELWETTVPPSQTGMYIIELWAEDTAGNVGYFATIKLTYDPSKLCFSIEIVDVGANFTMEDVLSIFNAGKIKSASYMRDVSTQVSADPVKSKIVRCEVCGE